MLLRELSDVFTSGTQRKKWHHEHKQVTGADDHDAGPADKLADVIAKAQNLPFTGPNQRKIAEAIRQEFDVREKTSARSEPPIPAIGQTWRNRQSDRLVRIVEIQTGYNQAIVWEALTGRGPKQGRVWPSSWPSQFEYFEDAAPSGQVVMAADDPGLPREGETRASPRSSSG